MVRRQPYTKMGFHKSFSSLAHVEKMPTEVKAVVRFEIFDVDQNAEIEFDHVISYLWQADECE